MLIPTMTGNSYVKHSKASASTNSKLRMYKIPLILKSVTVNFEKNYFHKTVDEKC